MRTNKEIIDYIDQLRQEQNLSIAELARRVNMSKSAVSRYFGKTVNFQLIVLLNLLPLCIRV
ncbi:helix-turn-helix transcriptional regulator [Lactobacillus sp. ESL0680]|uniref:helix-turn-helix domain-containing protein n=1 Tax=Lactobacillus sp. ESL0680 TaxID=2983210 RepID=UPI0023F872EA|nr:helix-turn-helix transcriptional regulator [Lactobacillus sp. ESL0680]WEV38627.1 helix-turn-helix transcriptional regulator [Lactobacillus sp. ESL0680]